MTPEEELLSAVQVGFPELKLGEFHITSPVDDRYNCIAWAASTDRHWFWPDPRADWPASVPRAVTKEAFIAAFATFGFSPCDHGELEEGYEKVALYCEGDEPLHGARQLPDGTWTSKLGQSVDITHFRLSCLEGPEYGKAVLFLRRPRREGA